MNDCAGENKSSSNPVNQPLSSETVHTEDEDKKKLIEQISDIQDKYKRCLAETENVRHRLQKQIEDAKLFGIQAFCKDLIEVADILAKATESIPKEETTVLKGTSEAAKESMLLLHQGLKLTESQLLKVFARHGLSKICPAEGEKFDPNYHEALFQQPLSAGKSSGTIAIVSKVGYQLHKRTLRPALVGVFGSN
jgi:molecular chaperone GrpE